MAGRPAKTLIELVRENGFRPARHHELLAGPRLPWPAFAALQDEYQAARTEAERRAVARRFLDLVRLAQRQAEAQAREAGLRGRSLRQELDRLGKPGSAERLLGFFPRFLFHAKGPRAGQRFDLEPYEERFLREFWRRDRHGERVYTRALFGAPKGSGKTPLASGLALFALCDEEDGPEVYQIAGSKEQAGIGLGFAQTWAGDGELAEWLSAGRMVRCPESRGLYRVLSSDGRLAQGVMPSAGIVDEWWLFATARERETFVALQNALHKRPGRSWLLATSTAGWDLGSQLGETYRAAIAHPRLQVRENGYLLVLEDRESGFLMHWWAAPEDADIEDPDVIRRANPASWLRPTDLLRQLRQPGASEADFRRLNLNQWTEAEGVWLPGWAQLAEQDGEGPGAAPVCVGVDAALTYDTTAVVWAWRGRDGRVRLRARVWSVRGEAAAHEHLPGDRLDNELLAEALVRELAREHHVRCVVCDRRYFATEAKHLAAAGIDVVELEQGSGAMLDATQGFYDAVTAGRVAHDGDPVLARHVAATAGRQTERGWRIQKLRSTLPIDATTAAIMAHYGVTALADGGKPDVLFL